MKRQYVKRKGEVEETYLLVFRGEKCTRIGGEELTVPKALIGRYKKRKITVRQAVFLDSFVNKSLQKYYAKEQGRIKLHEHSQK